MPPDPRDVSRLSDMLEASKAVQRFIDGRTRQDYGSDDALRSAVERKVEIIGEAARAVSNTFADSHPEIEWRKIRATRHILAHDYGKIDDDVMWRIATTHVSELIALLMPLIPRPAGLA